MKPTTSPSPPATSLLGRLVGKFLAALDRLVPYGYEDETGFHYNTQPIRVRHMVRFHPEPTARHVGRYRTRHLSSSAGSMIGDRQ
jgi:hypothetical protein